MPRAASLPSSLTALAALALLLAGCASLGAGDTGLRDELASTRAQAQAEHDRVAALEARLSEVERHSQAQTQVRDRYAQARVERLIEQNEIMLALAGASCDHEARTSQSVPTASFDPQEATDDKQRQMLAQRLRAYLAGRQGGLSIEQREAMRILLRPDRVLDRTDPWR